MQLRDYQQACLATSREFFRTAQPNSRLLWAAPTGAGKSYCELSLLSGLPGVWIVTPRLEIVAGLLDKLGHDTTDLSEDSLIELAWKNRITTPVRGLNRWMSGEHFPLPTQLIVDEVHHDTAETYQRLHLVLDVPAVGFTATPYRGTPQGTASLREQWGEPRWMITYEQAARDGFISMPVCSTIPLLDDDIIKVVNGEFDAAALTTESLSRVEDAARLIEKYWNPVEQEYDRAMLVAVPSVVVAQQLADLVPMGVAVLGAMNKRLRLQRFAECEQRKCVIIHCNVVAEGVDLQIRRLIDLSPTLSPVRWVQQIGRITRLVGEGEQPPEVVCCNRNLLRHSYVLGGALPRAAEAIRKAEEAFCGLGKRIAAGRVFGVESLGRLRGVEVPFANGLTGIFYCIEQTENYKVKNYAVIFHPLRPQPIWATREDQTTVGQIGRIYGIWRLIEPPNCGIIGFSSVGASAVTDKQLNWWKRAAHRFGLDAGSVPNRKQFQVLPVLSDLAIKVV